jgi:predicted O-methyltransferase YrrM
MTQEKWTQVDEFFDSRLLESDPLMDSVQETADGAGLPLIQVTPSQGKFLALLVGMTKAKRVLEVGTLGGYSTIWMARAMRSDGYLLSLEVNPDHARVAVENIERAKLRERIDIKVGPGADSMQQLIDAGVEPFDLFFIDADKPNNPTYFRSALRLARPGSVIIVDNVVRAGGVLDAQSNADVDGVKQLTELIADEPRVEATVLQTVGAKGWDGFLISVVSSS